MHFFNQGWLFFYKMALVMLKENPTILTSIGAPKVLAQIYKQINWDSTIKKASEFYVNPERMQEFWKSFDVAKKIFTTTFDAAKIQRLFVPSD